MLKNKSNINRKSINSICTIIGLIMVIFSILFFVVNPLYHNNHYTSSNHQNSSSYKTDWSPFDDGENIRLFFLKYKKKFPILSVTSLEPGSNLIYYKSDGEKVYISNDLLEDLESNKSKILNILQTEQSKFDKETDIVLKEFQDGDNQRKIDLLMSERGKAHLLYRYEIPESKADFIRNKFLFVNIYYNKNEDTDSLIQSLTNLVEYTRTNGKIISFNLIDVNHTNPIVLEEIRYSGGTKAVAYPVDVDYKYGFFYQKERQRQIDISEHPEYIVELLKYFEE